MMLGPLTVSQISFLQHNQPEDPPVEDTEGGSEDQEIHEEWEDALPGLETAPRNWGGTSGEPTSRTPRLGGAPRRGVFRERP